MKTIKLGSKGQITLPKSLREKYQLIKGMSFRLIELEDGTFSLNPVKRTSEMDTPIFSSSVTALLRI
jgi:AbrB family looped-hinge helix DNA binding protein